MYLGFIAVFGYPQFAMKNGFFVFKAEGRKNILNYFNL
jgi:hypothetical protein